MDTNQERDTSDALIGANVARYRGALSQKALADLMRERDWRWSQATVWAIEKGDRPLKLAEASDLADVLGLGAYGSALFLRVPEHAKMVRAQYATAAAATRLREAYIELRDAQTFLAAQVQKAFQRNGGQLTEDMIANVESWLEDSVVPELIATTERTWQAQWASESDDLDADATRGEWPPVPVPPLIALNVGPEAVTERSVIDAVAERADG